MKGSGRTLWPLAAGSSINRWQVSAAHKRCLPGRAKPMPDLVDYRFINGWVATGDLPCREAMRNLVLEREIRLEDAPDFSTIYIGGENPRVDFSTFCFVPTLIGRWARCILATPHAQAVRVAVETCGAVHLWSNDVRELALEPYDRNVVHSAECFLTLAEGETVITVYFDDLHERDTNCFFKVSLISGEHIETGVDTIVDAGQLRDVEATLAGIRTDRLFYQDDPIRLVCDYTPENAVDIEFDLGCDEGTSSDGDSCLTMNVLPDQLVLNGKSRRWAISKAASSIALPILAPPIAGCISLKFKARAGGAVLERAVGATVLPPGRRFDQPSLTDRKRAALAEMARAGVAEPSRALVLLELGLDPAQTTRLIESALIPIRARYDCADFWLLPLIWAYRKYAAATLDSTQWRQVRTAILGFRYWLDEPGNDVMWFWSENHVLCFHVAQYLAGDLFADETFVNSGKVGREHRDQARIRLSRWFDAIDEHGLAEWNSAAYYPIDLLGLLTLLEGTTDPEITERVRSVIDRIFIMVALHTISGVPAGSQGRVYEKELFAGPATELGSVAAIAFGGTFHPGHDRAAALFALSGYEPPALQPLAKVAAGHVIEARYTQGMDANARLALWKSSDVQLSTVAEHRTGTPGHQQHVVDIQFASHPLARMWVNQPGDLRLWGASRPSYWAGNGILPRVVQYHNIALLLYDLTRHDHPIDFTHLFCPVEVLDEVIEASNWLFARSGSGYAAFYGSAPLQQLLSGPYGGSEWRVPGRILGWVAVAGSFFLHGDFKQFQSFCHRLAPVFDREALRFELDHPDGRLVQGFDDDVTLDGEPIPFGPLSATPHVSFDGGPFTPWTGDEALPQ